MARLLPKYMMGRISEANMSYAKTIYNQYTFQLRETTEIIIYKILGGGHLRKCPFKAQCQKCSGEEFHRLKDYFCEK